MTLPNVLLPFASPVAGMPDDQTRNVIRGNDNTLLRAVNAIRDYVAAGIPVPDGDYGDITVSGGGTVWTIDAGAVSYAKMQDVSAASRLLGRGDSGTGDVQEIILGTNLSMSGTTLNATGGGGSAAWVEAEIDFGASPTYDATFTITDAGVSATTEVAVVQSGAAGTGRPLGDSLWDSITYAAVPAAGSFTLYALASPGPVVGTRKILYQIGT